MNIREITNLPALEQSPGVSSSARGLQSTDTAASRTSLRPDRADVSALAASLAHAADQPDVRQERVAALQQQLAAGTYQVSPSDVADALLRSFGR